MEANISRIMTATYLEHDGEGPLLLLGCFSPGIQVPRLVLAEAHQLAHIRRQPKALEGQFHTQVGGYVGWCEGVWLGLGRRPFVLFVLSAPLSARVEACYPSFTRCFPLAQSQLLNFGCW